MEFIGDDFYSGFVNGLFLSGSAGFLDRLKRLWNPAQNGGFCPGFRALFVELGASGDGAQFLFIESQGESSAWQWMPPGCFRGQ